MTHDPVFKAFDELTERARFDEMVARSMPDRTVGEAWTNQATEATLTVYQVTPDRSTIQQHPKGATK